MCFHDNASKTAKLRLNKAVAVAVLNATVIVSVMMVIICWPQLLGAVDDNLTSKPKALSVTAYIEKSKDGSAILSVAVRLEPGWHIYSVTQKPPGQSGGPMRTQLQVDPSTAYQVNGKPTTKSKPTILKYEFWPDLEVETHKEEVIWHIPIKFARKTEASKIDVKGTIVMQAEGPNKSIVVRRKFSARMQRP